MHPIEIKTLDIAPNLKSKRKIQFVRKAQVNPYRKLYC